MDQRLPFFNWSIKKTLGVESDSFIKARIRIVFAILLFSLLKSIIVVTIGYAHDQWLQVGRAVAVFVFYIALLKVLLYRPASLTAIAHVMIVIGILVVWTNVLVYAHNVNLVTVQFAFMVVLSSFYIMGTRVGVIYSVIGIFPILLFLFSHGHSSIYLTSRPQELVSPGFEIIIALNFLTIIATHYLFYDAYTFNIREKEKLNKQLQLSIAEANKMAASKSNFLSTISHELRTPLNSVIGITELLIEEKQDEGNKENLKILQHSALDLLSLINNVLDFNKIESDKLELESIPFRLAEFMESICLGLKMKAADKQLSLMLEIDEEVKGVTVVSDPTRLSQVIYNLVSNAVKFTDKGSVTVMLECEQKTEGHVAVLFSVTDTGIGINPERHTNIFEVFTQAESDITRRYGGTGLGLAIVKQILALFGSSIQLQSSLGEGSRFSFSILFTSTAPISSTAVAAPENADLGHLRVLVAEDNAFNRMIVKKQFNKLGIEPMIVEDGQEAYEAHQADNYDIILIDLHMPVMDGYATINKVRALENKAKASVYMIAFTASVNEQQKIADHGFNDYLYKPVNMTDLRDKLEEVSMRIAEGVGSSVEG